MPTKERTSYPIQPHQLRGDVAAIQDGPSRSLPVRVFLAGHTCSYLVRAGRTLKGPILLALQLEPLDGGNITAEDLRAISVKRLAAAAVPFVHPEDDEVPRTDPGEFDWSKFAKPEKPERKVAGRPPEYGEKHYAEVAEIARQARADTGGSARHAIAARWHIAPSTADKWMRKARELGHLELHIAPASRDQAEQSESGASTATGSGEVAS